MLRLLRGENPLVLVPTPSASQQRVITSPLKQNAVRYILSTRSCDALDGHWTRFIRLKSDNSGNGRNWYKLTLVDQTSSILLMILVNKKRLKVLFFPVVINCWSSHGKHHIYMFYKLHTLVTRLEGKINLKSKSLN